MALEGMTAGSLKEVAYHDRFTTESQNIYSVDRQTESVRGDTYNRTLINNNFIKYPKPAIAISLDVITQPQALQVQDLEFKNDESGTKVRCLLATFLERGVYLDRGFGGAEAKG